MDHSCCVSEALSKSQNGDFFPQGEVLSPILFTPFTADLADVITEEEVHYLQFADDLKIYAVTNELMHARLQSVIDKVHK